LIGWLSEARTKDSVQNETFAAARGLPLITYSAGDRVDVDAIAAAMSEQFLFR
jgi:hypothetical protein